MKKRLLSLCLSMVMVASSAAMLASCSDDNTTESDEAVAPMTVVLNMITDEKTTEKGIAVVQEAINKFTENDLNIHVELEMYTKDNYEAAIKAKAAARDADILAGTKYTSIGNADDKVKIPIAGDKYRIVTAFPKVYANQIDVFMVTSYDMLKELNGMGAFADFNEAIVANENANLITHYVASGLMDYGKIDGVQVAIPGNSYYGDYEYMIVKKDLFDKYPYSISDVTGLSSIRDYLVDVATDNPDVIPLYNVGSLGITSVTGSDSVVATVVADGASEATSHKPESITGNATVKERLAAIIDCGAANGNFAQDIDEIDFSKNFAAAFVKGDASTPDKYKDDYYVIKTRNPVADGDEIFNAMFAVSTHASSPKRCMGLVNLLMTNQTALNTLLYGVENTTYVRDEDTGVITRKYTNDTNSIYIMDENLVGNTFLAWQNDEMSEETLRISANNWELAKKATSDATYSPYARFKLAWNADIDKNVKVLNELYNELWTKIKEYKGAVNPTTGEQYTPEDFITGRLAPWLASYKEFGASTAASGNTSIAGQYVAWFEEAHPAN